MRLRTSTFLAAIGAISASTAMANHVDFIVDGGFMISGADGAVLSASQTGAGGNIIGSEREVTLTADVGTWSAELAVPTGPGAVGPGASIIGVTADTIDALGTLDLLYNGVGSAGLGGLDFDTNWNSIAIDLPSITNGSLDLRLTVADTFGNMGQSAMGGLTSAGNYYFAFTDSGFTNAGVDFTSVDSILVSLETIDLGVSYSVGGITREVAIPEPSSALLAAFATCGLVLRRRRNR